MSFRPVICVDLDHTLIQTDLSKEAQRCFLKEHPWGIWNVSGWIARGLFSSAGWMATLKTHLAQSVPFDATTLPYDPVVLEELKHWKKQGHTMVLVTGAPLAWAHQVAHHLDLFDDVWGTQTCNLIGKNKADFLIAQYGEGSFMYYGDSMSDLKVWPHAHSGVAVNPSSQVRQGLKALSHIPIRILETPLF